MNPGSANDAGKMPVAIVVGGEQTGLGTLRSLKAAGIEACVACPADDLAARSRWFRPTPGIPWDGAIDADTVQRLDAMPVDSAVLIPCGDKAALWLSGLMDSKLAGRFKASISSRETLEILQDKQKFGAFIAGIGIPHPRTYTICSESDIASIPFDTLGRMFLKPADSQSFSSSLGVKGVWAHGRDEFISTWRRLDALGFKVIAQEYVPGSAADHYFIDGFRDRHGDIRGMLARRRWRIHPPDFGNSSYCESVPLAETGHAAAHLATLLSALEYRGIFSAEFKRDERDGEFRILEVNTRAWWYVEFATACGVNVCAMAYDDALGRAVSPSAGTCPAGKGCVNLPADIRCVTSQRQTFKSWLRILRQWLSGRLHVFAWSDPRPGLSVLMTVVRNTIARRT